MSDAPPTLAAAILPAAITAGFGLLGTVLTVFKDDIRAWRSTSSTTSEERPSPVPKQETLLKSIEESGSHSLVAPARKRPFDSLIVFLERDPPNRIVVDLGRRRFSGSEYLTLIPTFAFFAVFGTAGIVILFGSLIALYDAFVKSDTSDLGNSWGKSGAVFYFLFALAWSSGAFTALYTNLVKIRERIRSATHSTVITITTTEIKIALARAQIARIIPRTEVEGFSIAPSRGTEFEKLTLFLMHGRERMYFHEIVDEEALWCSEQLNLAMETIKASHGLNSDSSR